MSIALLIIIFIFLLIASILDILKKSVPSVFLTSLIFIVLSLNVAFGFTINFGILAFALAYLLFELNFFDGVADIKIMIVLGLLLDSMLSFFILAIFVVLFGFLYKLFFRYVLKKKEGSEIPFIPCLLIVYVTMSILEVTGII